MAHFNRFMYQGLSMRLAVKMSDVRSRANNPGAIIVAAEWKQVTCDTLSFYARETLKGFLSSTMEHTYSTSVNNSMS